MVVQNWNNLILFVAQTLSYYIDAYLHITLFARKGGIGNRHLSAVGAELRHIKNKQRTQAEPSILS